MKTMYSLSKTKLALFFLLCSVGSLLAQPVSWTSSFDGSRQMNLDHSTGVKSVLYNPVNDDIYVFGQKYYYLPGNPGFAQTREFGVVRFDNVTGAIVNQVFTNHFTPTQIIPYLDIPGEMAIASDGSVYITGSYAFDQISGYDMIVIKYNASLVEQWRYYFRGTGLSNDVGTSIVIDAAGNICVAGQIGDNGTSTGADALIAKLSPLGTLMWQQILSSAGDEMDNPTAIATDNSNNVYATGYAGSATLGKQYAIVKFSSTGTVLWKRRYNQVTTAALDDIPNSIAVDKVLGNAYITGSSMNSSGNSDIVTVCYSASGNRNWVRIINNPGNSRDRGVKVIVDASGNVFVGGDVDKDASVTSNGDLIVRKYNRFGGTIGTVVYNGAGYNCSFGDLNISSTGSAYITASCVGAVPAPSSYASSLMTLKFSSTGVLQWSDLLSPPQFLSCGEGYFGWKTAVNVATSEVVSGGRFFRDCPGANAELWQLRRFEPTLRLASGIETGSSSESQAVLFPNPVDHTFTLKTNSDDGENYQVILSDLKGRILSTMVFTSGENQINVSSLSAGIYIVKIISDKETIFRRFEKL